MTAMGRAPVTRLSSCGGTPGALRQSSSVLKIEELLTGEVAIDPTRVRPLRGKSAALSTAVAAETPELEPGVF
jgi:hypothetical protein